MGSKYPLLRAAAVAKALVRMGFRFASQEGSHAKYEKPGNPTRTAIVPMHSKELNRGILKSILGQAGITLKDLMDHIRLI